MAPDSMESIRTAIRTEFWPKLIREMSIERAKETLDDSKLVSADSPTIFVPSADASSAAQQRYYADAAAPVEVLPPPSLFKNDLYIQEISQRPGLLALQFRHDRPLPYLVPGGRFNEFYGWDSYFIARGLLNDGELVLAGAIADQFAFEIGNYGKILNANRPYYLGRTQPPFFTDLCWRLLKAQPAQTAEFINRMQAAIREYDEVWASPPRFDVSTQLYKYYAQGFGVPPETEAGHFDAVFAPFARQHNLSIAEFVSRYNARTLHEPALDVYLQHDRSLRESGHDVTSRLVNCCADLCTIDLACLVYKYETDIAQAVAKFPKALNINNRSVEWWIGRAQRTREAANRFLWNEELHIFCDYNVRTKRQHHPVTSATTLWALWSGLASDEQGAGLVKHALPALECAGGLAATSLEPALLAQTPVRQWDYPCGWAPHQILAWEGLRRYGFQEDAQRLAQKWMATIAHSAQLTGGALFEKYAVNGAENPHLVNAEYGNQGSAETGFGWTNTSFALAYDHYQ